jgi:hypothetical protein
MTKNSRTDHFFIYPKDNRGKHTGHVICVLLRSGRMYEGTALCSKDDQFNKNEGRILAFERAAAAYVIDTMAKGEQPEPISNPYIRA